MSKLKAFLTIMIVYLAGVMAAFFALLASGDQHDAVAILGAMRRLVDSWHSFCQLLLMVLETNETF